jgi:hypothetical protein
MDGLVSTGNQIPNAILKIIFANWKNFPINFIHIFFRTVDIGRLNGIMAFALPTLFLLHDV